VVFDHRLLDGARIALAAKAFDRYDVRPVKLKHEQDARIDWAINQSVLIGIRPTDEDAAGATIPLAANDLSSSQAEHTAQIVGQREKCLAATDFVAAAVNPDQNVIEHRRFAPLARREKFLKIGPPAYFSIISEPLRTVNER
jgi:hypothetical protein